MKIVESYTNKSRNRTCDDFGPWLSLSEGLKAKGTLLLSAVELVENNCLHEECKRRTALHIGTRKRIQLLRPIIRLNQKCMLTL